MENEITLQELIESTSEDALGQAYLYLMEGEKSPKDAIKDAELSIKGEVSRRVFSQVKPFAVEKGRQVKRELKRVSIKKKDGFKPSAEEVDLLKSKLSGKMSYWLDAYLVGESLGPKSTHYRRLDQLIQTSHKILKEMAENEQND